MKQDTKDLILGLFLIIGIPLLLLGLLFSLPVWLIVVIIVLLVR